MKRDDLQEESRAWESLLFKLTSERRICDQASHSVDNAWKQHGESSFPAYQNLIQSICVQTDKTQKECKYSGGELLKLNTSQKQTCWIQVCKQFNTVRIGIWFQLWV